MARFNAEGIEGLALSFEEFSEIPDSVVEDMLMAGGEIIKKAHEDAIKRTFKRRSGHLADSPAVHLKAGSERNFFRRHVLIYPKGIHHTYHAKSGEKKVSNAEVGFVQEFGGHGNEPTQWMFKADLEAMDACVDAEFAVYDKWLKSKGL